MITIEKGYTSFCDNHKTRYWKFRVKDKLKRNIEHHIITYDNDLKCNKKYHCYVDYGGCIGVRTFNTDNLKEAVYWLFDRLSKCIITDKN